MSGLGSKVEGKELCIVVAVTENGVIGKDNGLPWHLPADLKHFKTITMGHPMIMGRRTFDSIGKALPGRKTIVITSQAEWSHDDVLVAHDLDEAIGLAEQACSVLNVERIMIVGGAQLYKQVLPRCERLFLTKIELTIEGDAFFPELDLSQWEEEACERFEADGNNSCAYSFLQLKRSK